MNMIQISATTRRYVFLQGMALTFLGDLLLGRTARQCWSVPLDRNPALSVEMFFILR